MPILSRNNRIRNYINKARITRGLDNRVYIMEKIFENNKYVKKYITYHLHKKNGKFFHLCEQHNDVHIPCSKEQFLENLNDQAINIDYTMSVERLMSFNWDFEKLNKYYK